MIIIVISCLVTENGNVYDNPLDYSSPVVISSTLSTSYESYRGFCKTAINMAYGKKSEDGKTIFWYSMQDSQIQLNSRDATYYFLVID